MHLEKSSSNSAFVKPYYIYPSSRASRWNSRLLKKLPSSGTSSGLLCKFGPASTVFACGHQWKWCKTCKTKHFQHAHRTTSRCNLSAVRLLFLSGPGNQELLFHRAQQVWMRLGSKGWKQTSEITLIPSQLCAEIHTILWETHINGSKPAFSKVASPEYPDNFD